MLDCFDLSRLLTCGMIWDLACGMSYHNKSTCDTTCDSICNYNLKSDSPWDENYLSCNITHNLTCDKICGIFLKVPLGGNVVVNVSTLGKVVHCGKSRFPLNFRKPEGGKFLLSKF